MNEGREAREETARELRRYVADGVAARLPLVRSLLAGALAGCIVFFVPVFAVAGGMLLISFTVNFGVLPLRWINQLFGLGVYRNRADVDAVAAEAARRAAPRPTEVPLAPIEGTLDQSGSALVAVALVLFWPLAMLAVGALVAALYRLRRARRIDELDRAPLEFSIWPEVLLFYALTASGGLLVGVGSFVALGINVIFSWAGFLIWRWLFDGLAWRAAPAHVRSEATARADREREYLKRLRESG